jgi:uncharacterized protein
VSRPALLDVNLLVALFNPDHIHHEVAHDWFADNRGDGWATCPITEQGVVRILANPKYWLNAGRSADILDRLRRFCASGHHQFWPDAVSLRDRKLFDLAYVTGYRQLTDAYLLGLALSKKGRLASFDRGIPIKAVKGATRETLAVIAAVLE